MENIFGVIVFLLFIVLRAMGDRKKGMKKEPVAKKIRPQVPKQPIPSQEEPVGMGKPSMQKPKLERRPLEPVRIGDIPTELNKVKPRLGEGESNYGQLSYMEGTQPDKEIGPEISNLTTQQGDIRGLFQGPEDLRKAIIWSEVIQKPRFKKRIYSR